MPIHGPSMVIIDYYEYKNTHNYAFKKIFVNVVIVVFRCQQCLATEMPPALKWKMIHVCDANEVHGIKCGSTGSPSSQTTCYLLPLLGGSLYRNSEAPPRSRVLLLDTIHHHGFTLPWLLLSSCFVLCYRTASETKRLFSANLFSLRPKHGPIFGTIYGPWSIMSYSKVNLNLRPARKRRKRQMLRDKCSNYMSSFAIMSSQYRILYYRSCRVDKVPQSFCWDSSSIPDLPSPPDSQTLNPPSFLPECY
jgi:hypothetical protein